MDEIYAWYEPHFTHPIFIWINCDACAYVDPLIYLANAAAIIDAATWVALCPVYNLSFNNL